MILRATCWLCAMIAFSVLSANGEFTYAGSKYPVYNCEQGPGDFVVVMGIFSWLIAMFYVAVTFANMVSSQFRPHKRIIAISELACALCLAFLWFVAFCLTTNKWTAGTGCCFSVQGAGCVVDFPRAKSLINDDSSASAKAAIQAAGTGIAFSFFNWWLWLALGGLVGKKTFLDGDGHEDDSSYTGAADPEPTTDAPYESFQNEYTQYDDNNDGLAVDEHNHHV